MATPLPFLLAVLAQSAASPPPRGHAAMVFDEGRGAVVLSGGLFFQGEGGSGLTFLDDLWTFDGKSWQKVECKGAKMAGQSLVYDAKRRRLLEFGGWAGGSDESGDLLALVPEEKEWKRVVAKPELARADAAIAFDLKRDRLVLFGGGKDRDETWEFDGATWSRSAAKGPDGNAYARMVWDAARQRIVLFNGQTDGKQKFGNTWEHDGSSWKKVSSSGPGPRTSCSFVYDEKRKRTVLFGGMGRQGDLPGTFSSETWAFDGTAWKKIADAGPSGLESVSAYDKKRDRIVLWGVKSHEKGGSGAETWEFDGTKWERRP
jgi:hypothetical protein